MVKDIDPDLVIAKAIEIYKSEGGRDWGFEMLNYEESHAYCVKAQTALLKEGYESISH